MDHIGIGSFSSADYEFGADIMDLFTPIPEDTIMPCIGNEMEIRPIANIQSNGPFEFIIPKLANTYIYLPLTRLNGLIKIVNNNGEELEDESEVSLVNYFPHSLFQNVEIEIGGKNISDQTGLYPYKAFLEAYLSFGYSAKNSHLAASYWIEDTPNHHNTLGVDNKGWKARSEYCKNSRRLDFSTNIHADIFGVNRCLIPETEVKIRFIRKADPFTLMTHEECKIQFLNLSMIVHKINPSEKMMIAHEKILKISPAIYPITRSIVKHFTVPGGVFSASQYNIFRGQIPRNVLVVLVDSEAFSGVKTKNPFNFQHFNVSQICLKIDGNQYPTKSFTPNFEQGVFRRELRALYDNIGTGIDNQGCLIGDEEFSKGSTIFAFDLTPDKCNGGHLHQNKLGILDLEVKFSEAITSPITLLLYATFESTMTIDNLRNVEHNFVY